MDRISKLERAKKRLSPAEIRTLFADLAEPFVPGLGAVREGMAGNYGTAAVSGLLDFGGPIGKAAGLAALPMMGMIRKVSPQYDAMSFVPSTVSKKAGEKISDLLESKYPGVSLSLSGDKDLYLGKIVVPKSDRGKGIGTSVMQDLINEADRLGSRFSLSPSSDFGGSVGRLKEFYKKFGFIENKGRNKDFSISESMYRPAQNSPLQAPQDEALRIAQENAVKMLGLPRGNTPMDRAKAMGFDKDIYHATAAKEDYGSMNPSEFGKIGPGVYTSFEPKYTERYASGEGSRILPLLSKVKIAPDEVIDSVSQYVAQLLSKNGAKVNVADWKRITNEELQKLGYSGRDVGKERLIFEPKNLRSRFAAFDPARINEKDLLASLAALGIGLPVASGLLGEEQYQ
jgi:GNAT superfamily N-acetyltransferase